MKTGAAADDTLKLCHTEVRRVVALKPRSSSNPGVGIVVAPRLSIRTGIEWRVDKATNTLKTKTDDLCIHERQGTQIVHGLSSA